jgi:hypothetical protein
MVHRSDHNPVRAENLQSSMMPQFLDSFRAPSLLRLVLIWFLPEAALDQKSIDFFAPSWTIAPRGELRKI